MPKGFLPNKDGELLAWSKNFTDRVIAEPGAYGVSAELAGRLADVQADWEAAYAAASAPMTRTRAAVVTKDEARARLRDLAAGLSRIIQGQPGVSDAQKIELGLNVRKSYSRVARPTTSPVLGVKSLYGRVFQVTLRERNYIGRGLPKGVAGAMVGYRVGQPDLDESAWTWIATSRATITLELPATVTPTSEVWFVAHWFNPRHEMGPNSQATRSWVQFGSVNVDMTLKAA